MQVGETVCSSDHKFSGLQEMIDGQGKSHKFTNEREFTGQKSREHGTSQSITDTEKEQMQQASFHDVDHEKELLDIERRIRNYTDSRFRDIEKSARERDERYVSPTDVGTTWFQPLDHSSAFVGNMYMK